MYIDDIFEKQIFPDLKEYLIENSKYKPQVVKKYTQESKVFPIVVIVLERMDNKYTTLTYGEEIENFKIDINVYSNDIEKTSKRTISNEITDLIVKWFKDNLKTSISVQKDVENIDNTIHRNMINISGVLDTKNGEENLVIYPVLTDKYTWFR